MYLIYDTETTGLPKNFKAPVSDSDNWPRMIQIAWQLHDKNGDLIENENFIIKPKGFDIPFNSTKIHGITTQRAYKEGVLLEDVLRIFIKKLAQTQIIVGHNIEFDQNILGAELYREQMETSNLEIPILDTMKLSVDYCKILGGRGNRFKFPKLEELHTKLFGIGFDQAHNASADVNATARSFMELIRIGVINQNLSGLTQEQYQEFKSHNPKPFEAFKIKESKKENRTRLSGSIDITPTVKNETEIKSPYFHFHNHTSFSILTATSQIKPLIQKTVDEKMPAVGITDYGNLMGAFHFMNAVHAKNDELETPIMPIIGCEIYISENYLQKKFTKENPDSRFTQLLLAKNKNGFKNLSKISSTGYVDGYYGGYPRVNKEIVEQNKRDLIATTGSISSEIPNLILNVGEKQAEESFQWWLNLFGSDFYVELIRHGLEEENHVNQTLIKFAEKYSVKILAQNNTFYLAREDSEAHDILLCVRDGEKKATEIGRGRDKRFGFPNNEFYYKSQQEMKTLFADIPESIENLSDFLGKFQSYNLSQDVLLPKFDIPNEFLSKGDDYTEGENSYLQHLAYEGAKKRYNSLTEEITSRLDFELATIKNTGYPGYFLIVQDFTTQARNMGVSVGPGRGSAAGSLVAYCIGITNVDPIKYDLLFERFLNPDRISLPDIDIDFDDRGRDKVIEWVVNKYGKDQVAQIITYGTMAGKSAIRDTGRVLSLPLSETDRIAKKTHLKLGKLLNWSEKELKEKLSGDEFNDAIEIRKLAESDSLEAETLQQAKVIEGSLRNTGIHACGIIITPTNIKELIPVTISKDADLLVTQFDNAVVEDAGLLKMDFLGLRTLTIIQDAINLIEQNHKIKLDLDSFPLDDEETFKIFQKGKTVAIFQYESAGMRKHLKDLKPDKFDDLIAMNALYRPGPLQYIPNFIARKHGREEIAYDLPEMKEYLEGTYGITVYQEQVMLLSQKLAGFTKGEADVLRKAMGKKQRAVLDKMKASFIKGASENNHPKEVLEKVWTDWEAFAQYAFNKSHSTCYALIAFQTAYLKAHYPAEFMAAVLSNNMGNIKTVQFFMEECRRMGIQVLGPDVNEGNAQFSVNANGAIRFGMAAVKGVGSSAVDAIIQERNENGKFTSSFDFVKRVNLRMVNKKTIENLILAGGFDELDEFHRAQYFYQEDDNGTTNIEKLIKFGASYQEMKESSQTSLFGDSEIEVAKPTLPNCEEWNSLKLLSQEKDVVGIYLSSHPLNEYQIEIQAFQNVTLEQIKDNEEKLIGRELCVVGMIMRAEHKESSKNGNLFGSIALEDYTSSYDFMLFGEDYMRHRHLLQKNAFVFMKLNITKNKYNGRVYVNITKMQLLQNILKEYGRKLSIILNLKDIDAKLNERIREILSKHKGEKPLELQIYDSEVKKKVDLPARTAKIDISKALIQELKEYNVQFRLN